VKPIGSRGLDCAHLFSQPPEIGSKQARGDDDGPGLGSSHVMFLATAADIAQGDIGRMAVMRVRICSQRTVSDRTKRPVSHASDAC
jgi:hypothetical protein